MAPLASADLHLSLAQIRLVNTLWLFEAFRQQVAPGTIAVRGLDKAFAAQLGISASYWAQIKSTGHPKNIGLNLARQFERKFHMPMGWLDKELSDKQPARLSLQFEAADADEFAFLQAASRVYRQRPSLANAWVQSHDLTQTIKKNPKMTIKKR